jgi:hypothetical protein
MRVSLVFFILVQIHERSKRIHIQNITLWTMTRPALVAVAASLILCTGRYHSSVATVEAFSPSVTVPATTKGEHSLNGLWRTNVNALTKQATPTSSTRLASSFNSQKDDWSDMERSRPTRRDVFSYDLWVDHRSTDRFIGNLIEIFKSEIFKALLPACFFTSFFALLMRLQCPIDYGL